MCMQVHIHIQVHTHTFVWVQVCVPVYAYRCMRPENNFSFPASGAILREHLLMDYDLLGAGLFRQNVLGVHPSPLSTALGLQEWLATPSLYVIILHVCMCGEMHIYNVPEETEAQGNWSSCLLPLLHGLTSGRHAWTAGAFAHLASPIHFSCLRGFRESNSSLHICNRSTVPACLGIPFLLCMRLLQAQASMG